MSGFAAVVRFDGGPVDRETVDRMAGALAFRGPDGVRTEMRGDAGFAASHLRTSPTGRCDPGPLTLDGETWAVAHATLSARGELAAALRGAGRPADGDASGAALLLHAWRAWGDDFLRRVHGDFAFALWDAPRRRLLCARDRMGVRPLWWARAGPHLLVSNTLGALRASRLVGSTLDPASIADFLAFGQMYDPAASPWTEIRSVPPAHLLRSEGDRTRVERYWEIPMDVEPVRRSPGEAVEAFVDLLGRAVEDRIGGTAPVGILLSGGRDSSSVAAMAAEAMGGGAGLRAHTLAHDTLMPDEERHWSGVAASALGIPHRVHAVDGYRLFDGWRAAAPRAPFPMSTAIHGIDADLYAAVAADARVALTGDGGDPLLSESRARLARLLAEGRLATALGEAWTYLLLHRRLPRPGFRTLAAERRGERWTPSVPPWIPREMVERHGLWERARAIAAPPARPHPVRPELHERMTAPFWAHWLTQYDAEATGVPLAFHHPFFDAKLVEFLMSVPPAQWYNDKGPLQIGMRGRLPATLLARPKTPLAGDPLALRLARGDRVPAALALHPALADWVDARILPRWAGGDGPDDAAEAWADVRPAAFSAWMTNAERPPGA